MEKRRKLTLVAALAAGMVTVLNLASPAQAQTSTGVKDDFYYSCDASVYITDDLIGSPGKIEAWGGFSCAQQYWGGTMRVEIWRNNVKVAEASKGIASAMTDHVDATTNNASGTQSWQAKLWLARPLSDSVLLTTGVIYS